MNVYIAGPLFNQMEIERNDRLEGKIAELGYSSYLPQRDGGKFAELVKCGHEPNRTGLHIFNSDISAVKSCDILVFLFDGRVPDEGACFELGMAYSLGKVCIGLCTDVRSFADGNHNLMIKYSLDKLFESEDALIEYMTILISEKSHN